jgi:hypothetical protein
MIYTSLSPCRPYLSLYFISKLFVIIIFIIINILLFIILYPMFTKQVIVDGKGHLLGRLASYVAK